jgi:hypothetical protein
MVTVEQTEHLKEAEETFVLNDAEVAHWFFRVPCAGVRYYTYEDGPVNSCSSRKFTERAKDNESTVP